MPIRKPKFTMKEVNGISINQRLSDGYINAVEICDACDKDFSEYTQIRFTKRFLNELSRELEMPVSKLVQEISENEIWIHPQVAINLANWGSTKLAVLIPIWVLEWMLNKKVSEEPKEESTPKSKFSDYDPEFGSWIDKAIAFDPSKKRKRTPKK